ncbi:MAG: hypothetical protein CL670_03705 [Balneola sp.]|mgnify:FL=1|jgi:hypothetical protein|nr:hypothetical protein [Balneola sp.]MBE78234.1 hypothetical protein [Balneola sp.]|tara:strand:- start:17045 stop:17509 length:465 start_codon:yes stop_codon:yes gene_type:complete
MLKKLYLPGILLFTITIISSSSLFAQAERPSLGVGVMIGEPTGVSVKKYMSERGAFDIGAAWSLANQNEALHIHANLLFQDNITKNPSLFFYHGVGARVLFASNAKVGIRAPLGLTYIFPNIPFDMFVEIAPILDVTPDIAFAGNGGFGFRYYF